MVPMEMVTLSLLKETKELSPVKAMLEPLSLDNLVKVIPVPLNLDNQVREHNPAKLVKLVSQNSHLNPDSPINLAIKVNKLFNHLNLDNQIKEHSLAKEMFNPKAILEPLNPVNQTNLVTRDSKSFNHLNLVSQASLDKSVNHNKRTKATKDNSLRMSIPALHSDHLVTLIHLEV